MERNTNERKTTRPVRWVRPKGRAEAAQRMGWTELLLLLGQTGGGHFPNTGDPSRAPPMILL